MAPAPPKRPGSPPPRRATGTGPRPAARREAPPEVEPATNDTVMGMDYDTGEDEPAESTTPGARRNGQEDLATQDEAPPPADATVVFDTRGPGARKAGPAAGPQGKLIVLKGPKQGAEFTLGPGETSIGRNADNTIVIPDISVSRKHVVLVKQGPGWLLQDQGSGNGTLMNGEKVGEHQLADGDVFVIGDTEIQYALQGAPGSQQPRRSTGQVPARRQSSASAASARPAPRPASRMPATGDTTGELGLAPNFYDGGASKKKKLRTTIMAVGGLTLVLVIAAVVVHQRQAAMAAAAAAAVEAEHAAVAQAAAASFAEGKASVQQGKFGDALPKFKDAKEKGSDEAELDDYIDRCTREMSSEAALKDSRESLAKGLLGPAMEAAKKVPIESLLSDQADELKKKIKTSVPNRVAEARTKINSKDWSAAAAILEDAAKIEPDDKGIADAQDELAKAQNKPPPLHVTKTTRAVDHTAEVVDAYKSGDLKRAKELAAQFGESDDNVKRLGQELASFETAYAHMDDDPSAFKSAHDLDMKIGKGHSFFSPKINSHVLAISLKQCVTAKTAGKLADAFRYCQAAHEADPNNADANGVLQDLLTKAKEIYLEGYQQKDSEPETARKAFKQVVDTTPSSEEIHQKAAARLKEMQ